MVKLRDETKMLVSMLHRGRVVPDLQGQGVTGYHELIVPPWRIIYCIS
jgi:plasmid stabilization system protein ParE